MEVAGLGPGHHVFILKTGNVAINIITIIQLNTLIKITNFNQILKIFIKNILNKWSWKDFLTIDKLLEKEKLKSNYLSILKCGRADCFRPKVPKDQLEHLKIIGKANKNKTESINKLVTYLTQPEKRLPPINNTSTLIPTGSIKDDASNDRQRLIQA